MAYQLSCSAACGIFPDQRSNLIRNQLFPALAGEFFTREAQKNFFKVITPNADDDVVKQHYYTL